jgi:tetratricopeptide (TPR) repeat protein
MEFRAFLRAVAAGVCLTAVPASARAEVPDEWRRPQADLSEAWKVRREVLAVGRDTLDRKDLDQVAAIQRQYGIDSAPIVTLALLKEVREREDDPAAVRAERMELARSFSPGSPLADYFHCDLRKSPASTLESIRNCAAGFRLELRGNEGRLRWLTNGFYALAFALAAFALAFFLYLVLRYRAPVSHVWAHTVSGLSPGGVSFLLLALLALAGLLLGWIGPFLLMTVLLWRHVAVGERVILVILAVAVLLLPLGFLAPALQYNYERGPAKILEQPLDGPEDLPMKASFLTDWIRQNPKDAQGLFTLALIERHTGRTAAARDLLEQAIRLRPDWIQPVVNLATIDYLEGKSSSAIGRLQGATASGQAIVAHFNLAKIFYKQSRLDEAIQETRKAKDIDAARFAELDRLSSPTIPRQLLVDERLTPADLHPRIWSVGGEVGEIRARFHERWFPMLPLPYYWIVVGGAFLFALLSSWIWPIRRKPRGCEKCGAPSCDLCDPLVVHESLCSQCYHIFVRLETIDPQARRRKEADIARYRLWRDVRERWLAIPVPGLHFLFRGNFVAGTLTLVGIAFFGALFVPRELLLASPYLLPGFPAPPIGMIGMMAFALTYAIVLYGAVRR